MLFLAFGQKNVFQPNFILILLLCIFVWKQTKEMNEKFEVIFLPEAREFLLSLDEKSRNNNFQY